MTELVSMAREVLAIPLVQAGLRVSLILVGAFIVYWLIKTFSYRMVSMVKNGESDGELSRREREKRATTLAGIVRAASLVVILVLAVIMTLREFGYDVAPLIAGAGIVGIAVGFGAQNLVRDVITGFFILLENQYSVGDVVQINGVSGVVTNVGLRTTKLRDLEGITHIMPNGTVELVSNITKEYSQALVDVEVAYKEDLDRVREVLLEVGREMRQDPEYGPYMLDEPQVLGVEAFGPSGITIRMVGKTAADQKWNVTRELRRRIKIAFDEQGIEIPWPHQKVFYYRQNGLEGSRQEAGGRESSGD
jgi:moderate conductance mechanosensitive channel